MIPRSITYSILIFAFLGFIDAAYLIASHYSNIALPCFIVQGCDMVTTSVYSKIFGIPVSLWGVVYYVLVFASVLYYVDRKNVVALKALHGITTIGFIVSIWFVYAQVFLIKEFCMYCLFSAGTSAILFILGAIAYHKYGLTKNHA